MRQRLAKIPHDSITLYNLGAAETALGHYKAAAAVYEQEVAQHPDDVRTLTALSAMYETSGDWQQAAYE